MVILHPDEDLRATTFDRVKEAAETDSEMNESVTAMQVDSFPDKVPSHNRYHCLLTVVDGILMYDRRMSIPRMLRQQVKASLHAAHQGVAKIYGQE